MFARLSLFAPFRRGDTRRSAVRTLRGLCAAQLADLGITPDGIEEVVDTMLMQNEHREEARRPAPAAYRPTAFAPRSPLIEAR